MNQKTLETVHELREYAAHQNGEADMASAILALHRKQLPENIRTWLQETRVIKREEAEKVLKQALELLEAEE